jgi:hypothetical protein
MMPAPPDELTLEDERQITATVLRYATGIDSRDWALFRTCFCETLHADYGQFGHWTSAEAITDAMERMHAGVGRTLHRVTNIVAHATAGGAHVRSYVDAILLAHNPSTPPARACGIYDDELVKTAQGWKIARRTFTAIRLL